MSHLINKVVTILVAVIVVSFFLPWVTVESTHVGTFAKMLTGKRQNTVDQISGFQIPIRANSDASRLAITIIRFFAPDVKNADKKSFFVWLVPGLGLILLVLWSYARKMDFVKILIGLTGIAVFVFALFKITTTDMSKFLLEVKIAYGLWLTLYSFLGIGVLSFFSLAKSKS